MKDSMRGLGGAVFAPGTTKRSTVSMYDTQGSHFEALPDGPYEAEAVRDQPTAQDHFNETREIKLKDPNGMPLPIPSYKDHYPPKELPPPEEGLSCDPGTMPFTARTEYMDEFFGKPRINRPVEPLTYKHKPGLWMGGPTTHQATFTNFTYPPGPATEPGEPQGRMPTLPPAKMPNDWSTTYRNHYIPKEPPGRVPTGDPQPRPAMPWLANGTTYRDHYVPKELALVPITLDEGPAPYPFTGRTEYQAEYVPKEGLPQLPPLTGVIAPKGLKLPLPRRSLGVEFWHRGKTNNFFILINRTLPVPCTARQIFTTVHDNQEVACILVLYGDDPVASNNTLLGQFDIVNIPPAPKDVPRIEVRFHLDKDMYLTVEAKDLDTERHKLWQQRGTIITLKE